MKSISLPKTNFGVLFLLSPICILNSGCKVSNVKPEKQPNVLIIYTDDQAQWTVGAYGNKEVHTPNMDRLASEGVIFTQGFTKTVCSPSRAMLLTGIYSDKLGIPDFIPRGSGDLYAENGLPAGTPTIASMLKKTGYVTGLVGKWHLGYGEKYYPDLFGFDHAEGYRYVAPGDTSRILVNVMPYLMDGKEMGPQLIDNPLHTDMLAEKAIDFIRTNRQKPFFLYLSTYLPHGPWDAVTEEDRAYYKDRTLTVPDPSSFPGKPLVSKEQLQAMTRQYYTCVTDVDRNIGKVLDVLDELNLADNTIVIFIGDNGFMIGQHGLDGKGNAETLYVNQQGQNSTQSSGMPDKSNISSKELSDLVLHHVKRPNMFDNSIIVPFIIRWPGVVKPGTRSNALVSTIDILPTLAEINGIPTEDLHVDGSSLLPLLQGKADSKWRTAYCDTYNMIYLGNNGEKPYMRMIRTDDWKLILYEDENGLPLENGTRHELFNLKTDPGELKNLYGSKSVENIQGKLDSQLHKWMRENEFK